MTKGEYLEKLKNQNRNHISNLQILIKTMNFNIEKLKKSKVLTDNIEKKFNVNSYNYNLVYEMIESKTKFIKDLEELVRQIQKISARKSSNTDYDIQRMQSIGDLLYTYETQLGTINRNDLSNIENLQLNAIKKEIYEKFMRYRAEIDRAILMEKFEKMKNRNFLIDTIYKLFVLTEAKDLERENIFSAIKGIDDCVAGYNEAAEPTKEYKIIDILADIEIYLDENKRAKKYKNQYEGILKIRDNIYSTFSIERKELKKTISNKYKSKYPMPIEKNITRMKKKLQKTMEFLYKSGYVKSYENVEYKSKMEILIRKIELLSEHVRRELER
ncbi:MAG: hypothetical protein J6J36_03695 [Clostridia bacterium]|nr:hypothetical protein [Clostridia bacterium]